MQAHRHRRINTCIQMNSFLQVTPSFAACALCVPICAPCACRHVHRAVHRLMGCTYRNFSAKVCESTHSEMPWSVTMVLQANVRKGTHTQVCSLRVASVVCHHSYIFMHAFNFFEPLYMHYIHIHTQNDICRVYHSQALGCVKIVSRSLLHGHLGGALSKWRCVYVHVCVCVCVRACMCMCVYMHVCACVCVRACVHVCVLKVPCVISRVVAV